MKSYYCFIRNFGHMKAGNFVYHVAVGTNQTDQTRLALVQEYCKDCGIYFKKWCTQVDEAIDHAAAQFKPVGLFRGSPFIHPHITIQELYSMILDDSFAAYERNYVPTRSELWCSFRNLPTFIQSLNLHHCDTPCQPHGRKYLSRRKLTFREFMVVGQLVAAIFYMALYVFTKFCLETFGAI